MRDAFDRVIVFGLGSFGGGAGVAKHFARLNIPVLVVDRQPADRLAGAIASLEPALAQGLIALDLGRDDLPPMRSGDLLIVNPAVPTPWNHAGIAHACECGAQISTEIEVTLRAVMARCGTGAPIVGITGSNGKSTTTSMLGAALNACEAPAAIGGNLGGSLLESLERIAPGTIVVLELSSAMLHWLSHVDIFSPSVAIVTNFSPNHLDWHGSIEHYRRSKQVLLTRVRDGGTAVLGPGVHDWPVGGSASRVLIEPGTRFADLSLPGQHNELNAACAMAAARALGLDEALAAHGIRAFPGLEHRLCLVHRSRGVRCYDDSKSTTPDATLLAIRALREADMHRIHLIAGGYDKGVSLASIADLAGSLASLAGVGATAQAICEKGGTVCHTLDRAVEFIARRVQDGDAILLSPGCASWDQFTNFTERGRLFADLVRRALP